MKKNAEGISVNTGRATFLLQNKWFYIHNVRSSRPEFSVIQPFRTFRKLLLLYYYYYIIIIISLLLLLIFIQVPFVNTMVFVPRNLKNT